MAPNTPLYVFLVAALGCCALYNPVWADGRDFDAPTASGLALTGPHTLESPVHLVDGIEPVVDDDHVRAVIEIPAGSVQKWEVDKADGHLKWEMRNGAPRIVEYIGYPGNYGLVPRTRLAEEDGGDNDPLDVLVLGPPLPRGSIVEVKVIGLLKMRDKGKDDNKLIAVTGNHALGTVDSIGELDEAFPGTTTIIETWFANYKGGKKVETDGFSGVKRARRELQQALDAYAPPGSDGVFKGSQL
jgi:inorganic pyrophosphatase